MTQPPPTRSPLTNIPQPQPSPPLAGRFVASMVVAAMTLGMPLPAAAGPAEIDRDFQDGSRTSARALTEQGQAAFDAGDYAGAAAAWSKILEVLPEGDLNREERENGLLIALEAYKYGYRRGSAEGAVGEDDIALLRQGLALCDAYTKEYGRVHGGSVSPAVVESRVEIEAMLADVGQVGTAPVPRPIVEVPGPQDPFGGTMLPPGPSGNVLIGVGSATIVVGLAMIPLVVVGSQRANQANQDLQDAQDEGSEEGIRAAEDRKSSANAMIISGSVLLGVLTAGGATMLGIGIHRRIRYTAFAPAIGPSYVGLSLQGRF